MPLDTPASSSGNTPTPMRGIFPKSPPKVFDPKIIAKRYVVTDTIGQGGMGKVYRARDTVLTRKVAVKVLPIDRYALHYARFQREAKAASQLDHPNIVKALDFGLTREGQPFFVMEHLEGETLEQMIAKSGRLTIDQFIEIFSQVASAMDHAHRENVIHRDLKTTNVIVSRHRDREGEFLKASVLDFGIAKILTTSTDQVVTHNGEVLGTPTYMSPEQASGEQVIDGRSDIYSLGCMMFEVLTGSPPFVCNSSLGMLQKHILEIPPTLAERANAAFPEELEMIVARAIEKDPAERYQTMFDLLMDIEHLFIVLNERESAADQSGSDYVREQLNARYSNAHITKLAQLRRSTIVLYSLFWLLTVFLSAAIVAILFVMHTESQISSFKTIDFSHEIISKSWAQAEDVFNTQLIPELNSLVDDDLRDLKEGVIRNGDMYLILRDSEATDVDLKKLSAFQQLIEIDLTNTGVTEACIPYILGCKKLNQLALTNTLIKGRGLERLKETHLQVLRIGGCGLQDSDVERISRVATLKSLYLDHNPNITVKGWSSLRNLPALNRLSVVASDITDDTMGELAKIKTLKILDLCKNDLITPEGLKHFAGNSDIFIRVSGCKNFKDRSLRDLSAQYGVSLEGLSI